MSQIRKNAKRQPKTLVFASIYMEVRYSVFTEHVETSRILEEFHAHNTVQQWSCLLAIIVRHIVFAFSLLSEGLFLVVYTLAFRLYGMFPSRKLTINHKVWVYWPRLRREKSKDASLKSARLEMGKSDSYEMLRPSASLSKRSKDRREVRLVRFATHRLRGDGSSSVPEQAVRSSAGCEFEFLECVVVQPACERWWPSIPSFGVKGSRAPLQYWRQRIKFRKYPR